MPAVSQVMTASGLMVVQVPPPPPPPPAARVIASTAHVQSSVGLDPKYLRLRTSTGASLEPRTIDLEYPIQRFHPQTALAASQPREGRPRGTPVPSYREDDFSSRRLERTVYRRPTSPPPSCAGRRPDSRTCSPRR